MISRPRNRLRANSESVAVDANNAVPSSSRRPAPHGLRTLDDAAQMYPHTSTFKSPEMTIKINSPSVRVVRRPGQDNISLPIFGDNDHVAGTVTLDPQNCAAESGRLTISIEGVFEYVSPMNASKPGPSQIYPGKHKHVFYQDSAVIPLYVSSEPPTKRPFRSALTATIKRAASSDIMRPVTLKQARSMDFKSGKSATSSASSSASNSSPSSPSASPRVFNFDFTLPKSDQPGDEFPPTFSSSNVVSAGVRGRVYAENADVKYRVKALWEALDGSGIQSQLEAQILFHADSDFQSLDGLNGPPDAWTETPLSKVDGVPVECAITIPNPADFSRASSIPYFVVFTTTPRSRSLAAEIMADATIAVSLVRRVGFDRPTPMRARALTMPSSTGGKSATNATTTIPTIPTIPTTLTTTTPASRSSVEVVSPTTSPTASDQGMPSVVEKEESASTGSCAPLPIPEPGPSSRERSGSGSQRFLKRVVRSAPPILSGFRLGRSGSEGSINENDTSLSSIFASRKSSAGSVGSTEKPLPTLPLLTGRLRSESKSKPPSPTTSSSGCSSASSSTSLNSLASTSATSESSSCSPVMDGPEIPPQRVTDTRTLHTDVSVGFPKRPKGRSRNGTHPSIEVVSALPDGLYKGNIPLQKGWFPSIQWKGLKIEYFLQVSVIFDNAEFKGQVPLRIN